MSPKRAMPATRAGRADETSALLFCVHVMAGARGESVRGAVDDASTALGIN